MNNNTNIEDSKIEAIHKWTKTLFAQEGQFRRFEIELNEILEECKHQNYDVDFVQNSKTKRWIEIEIGLKRKLELYNGNEMYEINTIVLSIQIGKEYPAKDVRVVCKTSFVKPTLADGRNLLPDILKQPWNHKLQLISIVKEMPIMLDKILHYREDKIYLQNIGQYYLGTTYSIDELKEFHELARFPTIQYSNTFFQQISVRLICLSEGHFYLFDVQEGKDELRLIFRAPLQSCTQLKRKKESSTEIQIIWRNYKNKQEETQIFTINNEYDQFIRLFLRRLNYYQHVRMTSNSHTVFGDQSAAEKQKIQSIMKNLNQLETEIEFRFNHQTISKLMDLYQQAIEFYSSASDYLYEIYLNKLQSLIQRQDVQVILQYKQQQ